MPHISVSVAMYVLESPSSSSGTKKCYSPTGKKLSSTAIPFYPVKPRPQVKPS